jgi:hypothetical protein
VLLPEAGVPMIKKIGCMIGFLELKSAFKFGQNHMDVFSSNISE